VLVPRATVCATERRRGVPTGSHNVHTGPAFSSYMSINRELEPSVGIVAGCADDCGSIRNSWRMGDRRTVWNVRSRVPS
jgi:hypothetical protein